MSEPILIRCGACGASNRLPPEKVRQGFKPVCGRCKAALPVPTEPVVVTDTTFRDQVERSSLPVIVDMWAPWCGPCRFLAPVVDELAVELVGRVRVAKMNVDENPKTAARFGIQSIPALVVIQGGREVDRIVGVQPKSQILRRLERLIA